MHMFGSEFNGEPPARAMGVPLRGAPFVSSGFTEYLPKISCFCLFLLARPCLCWVRTWLFLFVSAGACWPFDFEFPMQARRRKPPGTLYTRDAGGSILIQP